MSLGFISNFSGTFGVFYPLLISFALELFWFSWFPLQEIGQMTFFKLLVLVRTKWHRRICLEDSGMKTLLSIMVFMGLAGFDILVLIVYQISIGLKIHDGSVKFEMSLERQMSLYLLCLLFCRNWLSWNREKWWPCLQDYDAFISRFVLSSFKPSEV